MLVEKKRLSLEDIEAQTALELPEREIMGGLVTVVLLNGAKILVPINVAANLCGIDVNVLAQQQRQGPVVCNAKA